MPNIKKSNDSVCVILLCGGKGTRMQNATPKQFLEIKHKKIALYSFEVFDQLDEVCEIVVVADLEYRHYFNSKHKKITFAEPGIRRQDSVYNGFSAITTNPDLICVHDGARPFITCNLVKNVIQGARECGAATAGMPIKFTIKEHNGSQIVTNTPDRSLFWEIQTPQIIKTQLFKEGFDYILANQIEVTDDVSVVEHLKAPVKLVEGSYRNLKVTTPEDLILAENLS
jgi:2-C-methyl-D-erythritol 4-phosphate cytidylyltransferase